MARSSRTQADGAMEVVRAIVLQPNLELKEKKVGYETSELVPQ